MKILIDTTRSIEENATYYYEKSKKAKRKVEGLKKAIAVTKQKIASMDQELKKEKKVYKEAPERKSYMKFRWFTSSDGFICIGGRDAATNEIIIKKHTEKGDLVFHTDIRGSPFFIIKANGRKIPDTTKEEAAIATASFSKAWKEGLGTTEVYAIAPDQVQKGLGLPKGSFMIHGKRTYYKPVMQLYVTKNNEDYLECTPVKSELKLKQGGKISDTAKKIRHIMMEEHEIKYDLDDIIRILPSDCSLDSK